MSEIGTYELIKSAKETAARLGFKLKWNSSGWEIEKHPIMEQGETALELHHYLNGYRDGRSYAQRVNGPDIEIDVAEREGWKNAD